MLNDMAIFSNKELLQLVIGDSANDIWNEYHSLSDIATATPYELKQIKGVGEKKALSVCALNELTKRMKAESRSNNATIRDCTDVVDYVFDDYYGEKREILIALLLNVKGEVESKEIISIGELSATNVHPREVFSPAIRKGAAGIIITHNHPSGDPTPSEDDILSTRRLIEASRILGIKLLDHVIVGNGNYISLKVEGIIPSD